MKIVKDTAEEKTNPLMVNKPINVLSDTPIPPGMNDATPRIIEVV